MKGFPFSRLNPYPQWKQQLLAHRHEHLTKKQTKHHVLIALRLGRFALLCFFVWNHLLLFLLRLQVFKLFCNFRCNSATPNLRLVRFIAN